MQKPTNFVWIQYLIIHTKNHAIRIFCS